MLKLAPIRQTLIRRKPYLLPLSSSSQRFTKYWYSSSSSTEESSSSTRTIQRWGDTISCLRDAKSGKEIYLLGTAHVSQASVVEATTLIQQGL